MQDIVFYFLSFLWLLNIPYVTDGNSAILFAVSVAKIMVKPNNNSIE